MIGRPKTIVSDDLSNEEFDAWQTRVSDNAVLWEELVDGTRTKLATLNNLCDHYEISFADRKMLSMVSFLISQRVGNAEEVEQAVLFAGVLLLKGKETLDANSNQTD